MTGTDNQGASEDAEDTGKIENRGEMEQKRTRRGNDLRGETGQELILGRYRPLEFRGRGGMATVEAAWDTRIHRRVALKHIPLDTQDPDGTPGLAEARAAAMLSSPNIVQVIDFEVTDTEALLILEFIDGPTLDELMAEDQLSLDEIATVVNGVGEALSIAHENQLLHLDVKPSNILVDHSGNIKVTDFGIARLGDSSGHSSAIGGTIGYMPPEQLTRHPVGPYTDQWAFAVVVYEMLTGFNPFLAKSADASLDIIENGEIPIPSALRDDVDEGIDDVIFDALSIDPNNRYKNVQAFCKALKPFLGEANKGKRSLQGFVDELEDDETDRDDRRPESYWDWDDEDRGSSGLVFSWRETGLVDRVIAALLCGFVGWLGAGLFSSMLPALALAGIVAGVVIIAALIPRLGAAVALWVAAAGCLFTQGVALGCILLVLSLLWWVPFGRHFNEDAVLTTGAISLSSIFLGYAAPVLTGYLLPWRRALITSIFSALLLMLYTALTGAPSPSHCGLISVGSGQEAWENLLLLVNSPHTWAFVLGWILSAVLVSVISSFGGRVVSCVSAVLGLAIIIAAQLTVPLLFPTAAGSAEGFILPLVLSTLVSCVFVFLDMPDRMAYQQGFGE